MASAFSTMKVESTALSGLPAPFLDAMRRLFDIMDCDKVGWIHIDGNADEEKSLYKVASMSV